MSKRLLIVILLVVALSRIVAADTGAIERPEVKVGDTWTYRTMDGFTSLPTGTGVLEVVAVGNQTEIALRSSSGKFTRLVETPDTNTVERVPSRGNAVRYSPHSGRMAFPLYVGKGWTVRNSFTVGEAKSGTETLDGKVVGWEEVVVPAGTFTTLRVVWTGYYSSTEGPRTGTGVLNITLWYAPEVKRAVKSDYRETDWNGRPGLWSVTELVAHRVN